MNIATPLSAASPETIVLRRKDGTRFALLLFPAADPAAPMLLIQPAMGVKAAYYLPFAEALREAGYNAAIAELRGHEAKPDRIPGWTYDFGYQELVEEDWPLAVAALRARIPAASLYLLGHSLGGLLSSFHAARRGGGIAGLILMVSGSIYWRHWPKRQQGRLLAVTQLFVLLSHLLGHFPGRRFRFSGREARTLMADWGRQARNGNYEFGRPRRDWDKDLAGLALPVLAVSLKGDRLTPRQAMDALVAKMPKAQLTRVHLDPQATGFSGIDHFRWARQPGLVLPTIAAWLAHSPRR